MAQSIHRIIHGTVHSAISVGSVSLSCLILENHIRVFNCQTIGKSVGYNGKSEVWLYEFMLHISRFIKIPIDYMEAIDKGILFYDERNIIRKGITPSLLIEACNYISSAKNGGFLYLSELQFAKAAEIILEHADNINTKIDVASGYERYKSNHKEAIARFMVKNTNDPALNWTKTFSDEFFEEIFTFYDLTWNALNKDAAISASVIYDLIFARVEKDVIEELRMTKPKMKYSKKDIPENYLEYPKLQAQMHAILALLKASGQSQTIFTQLLDKTFPKVNADIFWIQKSDQNPIDFPNITHFNEALETAVRNFQPKKNKNN